MDKYKILRKTDLDIYFLKIKKNILVILKMEKYLEKVVIIKIKN